MISVRPIAPGDVELLAREVKPTPLLHQARAQLQSEGLALYLVALDDGTPVGHALLKLPPLGDEHPRVHGIPEVEDLHVASARRSQGVGTLLLVELERAAHDRGHAQLGLSVGVDNTAARRLYERQGFVDAGLGDFWVEGADETCNYLVKSL